MTRDDIIRMAWNARLLDMSRRPLDYLEIDDLERFATLVAAAEREACARMCDEAHELRNSSFQGAAAAIRARSQQ